MKLALPALVFSISLAMPLYAIDKSAAMDKSADASSRARAELQQLVERFKHALQMKDGEAIRGMFLPGGSGFRVLDRTSLAVARAKDPEAVQAKPWKYEEFAKSIGTIPEAIEETFDNVRIETDGTVGMVWVDYRFIDDGKQSNHGVETWQVVRESDGWKISAMLFSVTLDNSH